MNLLAGKDEEIEALKTSEAYLNQQIGHLNAMLSDTWKEQAPSKEEPK